MTRNDYLQLLDDLGVMPEVSLVFEADDWRRLKQLTPATYTGASAQLAGFFVAAWHKRQSGGPP